MTDYDCELWGQIVTVEADVNKVVRREVSPTQINPPESDTVELCAVWLYSSDGKDRVNLLPVLDVVDTENLIEQVLEFNETAEDWD